MDSSQRRWYSDSAGEGTTKESWFNSRQRWEIIEKTSTPPTAPTPRPAHWVPRALCTRIKRRGVKLIALILVMRLRISVPVPPLPHLLSDTLLPLRLYLETFFVCPSSSCSWKIRRPFSMGLHVKTVQTLSMLSQWFFHCCYCTRTSSPICVRGADKSLARPTSRCVLFDGENISFDTSLVIYK
jgi:hypothetical protein